MRTCTCARACLWKCLIISDRHCTQHLLNGLFLYDVGYDKAQHLHAHVSKRKQMCVHTRVSRRPGGKRTDGQVSKWYVRACVHVFSCIICSCFCAHGHMNARVIVYATLVSAITASPKFDNARNSWMYLHIQMCVLMCVRVAHACVRA